MIIPRIFGDLRQTAARGGIWLPTPADRRWCVWPGQRPERLVLVVPPAVCPGGIRICDTRFRNAVGSRPPYRYLPATILGWTWLGSSAGPRMVRIRAAGRSPPARAASVV